MLEALIAILIVSLVLALIWYVAARLPFMAGLPLQVLSIILAIVWILYALNRSGILGHTSVRI